MLTIVFYATNGHEAKQYAREIAAREGKGHFARVYDVANWDGTADKCDAVEIMPDVPGWQRERITAVFGEVQEVDQSEVTEIQEPEPPRQQLGLMPEKKEETPKKAVHRGAGRWFVMSGEEILSGPHEKAEAVKLASEPVVEA